MVRRFLALALLVVALASTPQAVAGPLEDGVAAAQRGDYATALRLWRPLAEQGSAAAQFNLGLMYTNGRGVPKDDAQAVFWWRKSAEQRNTYATFSLGVSYSLGQGVPQDYVQAHMWVNLSASTETDPEWRRIRVKVRDDLAAKMTREQIAEAQRLARE